ncbi:AGE family epimerase/isomerase [Lunatibacter salilacus]|uniref:AGE family epimerase/isomerase n=1 Tax=Lunatibacter salilacus TaxID=2483804 RepID=UPI00131D5B54|nr:AGE family epimerase/isomerase [Lunatibacter salilacus]
MSSGSSSKTLTLGLIFVFFSSCDHQQTENIRENYAEILEYSIQHEMLNKWYPLAYDKTYGGYISAFEYDFTPSENQHKMIVSQARHLWTTSKAAMNYPDIDHYREGADHGFLFIRDKFWDSEHGGFHTLLDQEGNVISSNPDSKTAYGNAFGIYGLAAYYEASGNEEALDLAQKAFLWLEENSYDAEFGGYFQNLAVDGTPLERNEDTPSTSTIGYKDQNSSIHLLEAFSELYHVWKDPLLKRRLEELLVLIRDTIVQPEGYLQLFLYPDWRPVSFRDSSESIIQMHHAIDHVSYGHDVETAYLMMEASEVLGLENDTKTWEIGKKMVDHALEFGWDDEVGGFYDGGYYFKGESEPRVVKDTKNWWAQAEGLNTLLIFADLYPDDPWDYFSKFELQWTYIDQNLIDHEHGEWYSGGIDKQPNYKTSSKGNIWKTAYHNYRSLANCVKRLKEPQI